MKQKAVFLDRDGTINKYVGFLKDIDHFELIDGVAQAVRMINRSGYLAIVITNQPVIARGEVSWEELEEIHNKMETLLGNSGAYIDDIFCCPHHPDQGFAGERKEYKKYVNAESLSRGCFYRLHKSIISTWETPGWLATAWVIWRQEEEQGARSFILEMKKRRGN